MQAVLTRFNRKLLLEQRKVVLILDNATCHPKSIIDSFLQIKIIFLPKNSISRLQPLDAGIIQNFKVKYRKRLVKYVLARINEYSSTTQIIKDTDGNSMGSRSTERSNRDNNKELFWEVWDYQNWWFNGKRRRRFRIQSTCLRVMSRCLSHRVHKFRHRYASIRASNQWA